MPLTIHTYIDGPYRAEVLDNAHVNLYFNDDLIDWPGPWADIDGAQQWAQLIVAKYAVEGHKDGDQES